MMSYDYPHPVSRTYQYKKITKPLLERKRRARINRCLDELKDLMVDALETEGESISKLEKADILELTVRHLQRLQASRPSGLSTVAIPGEDSSESRWRSGFGHCAAEACRFLTALPGEAADRLARHLATGLQPPTKHQLEVQVSQKSVSPSSSSSSSSSSPSINSPPLSPATNPRPAPNLVSPTLANLEKTANKLSSPAPSISPAVSPSLTTLIPSSSPPLPPPPPPQHPNHRQNNSASRATSHPYSSSGARILLNANNDKRTTNAASRIKEVNNVRSVVSICSVGKEIRSEKNDRCTTDGGAPTTTLLVLMTRPVEPTGDGDRKMGDTRRRTIVQQQIVADDEEEIDVENIDEGEDDPMWRPW